MSDSNQNRLDMRQSKETLCDVCNGSFVRIKGLKGNPNECHRLREMGFSEKECLRKVSDNGALLCRLKNSQVMISEELAKGVFVEEAEDIENDIVYKEF